MSMGYRLFFDPETGVDVRTITHVMCIYCGEDVPVNPVTHRDLIIEVMGWLSSYDRLVTHHEEFSALHHCAPVPRTWVCPTLEPMEMP